MWKRVKLGDECLVRRGTTITKKQTIEGEVPVIGGGMKPTYFHNEPNRAANCITVSGSGASAGFVNKWEVPIFASDCSTVEPKDETQLHQFVYYYLMSQQQFIYDNFRSGAAQPHVYARDLETLDYPIIPLAEQQRIVAKLDAAFAEIDRAIDALEEQLSNAPSIFSQYLSKISAASVPLGEIVDIKTGKLNANAMEEDGIYPFFTCSRDAYKINTYAFDCDAVLLAGNNAAGEFNVKHYEGKFNAYQRTYILTVRDETLLRSRYLYFQLINALKKFKRMSVGAGTKFLKLGMIQGMHIPLPSLEEQDEVLTNLEALQTGTDTMTGLLSDKRRNLSSLKSAILTQELQPPQSEAA